MAHAFQLELLLIAAVNLIRSVDEGDFMEAQFRVHQLGDIAWEGNNSTIGNAAMNLEVALRDGDTLPLGTHEDLLAYLLAELDVTLKPLREG